MMKSNFSTFKYSEEILNLIFIILYILIKNILIVKQAMMKVYSRLDDL